MNDHHARAVDWPTVLTRAHRRVAVRLALAAGVGVVGAVLLLGGGSATRASIQDNAAPPPSKGPTGPGDPGSEQPNLVIAAEAVEPAEGEEVTGKGWFIVSNKSSIGVDEFEVVAMALSGKSSEVFPIPALAPDESAEEFFECPPGDSVVLEIKSEQPHEDPETLECPGEVDGPTGATEPTGSTGPTGATGPTEPPEIENLESPEIG